MAGVGAEPPLPAMSAIAAPCTHARDRTPIAASGARTQPQRDLWHMPRGDARQERQGRQPGAAATDERVARTDLIVTWRARQAAAVSRAPEPRSQY